MHWDVYRREPEEALPTAATGGTSKLSGRTRTIGLHVPYSTSALAHEAIKTWGGGCGGTPPRIINLDSAAG